MLKVIEIEHALNRINGDIFQEFCNHFLYLKLNPNTITPIGSVIGKEKSRKGIPDSYFTSPDNQLIFAEYTTRERLEKGQSFYNKLKSDIENCFDTSKTGLKKEEISKVILCFTERIKPDEKKKLEDLCKTHNPECILDLRGIRDLAFAVLDYPVLGTTYLGINIGTGQIQEPSEFIANYEKNKISTPLSNTFFGRVKELEDGENHLETNDLLLIHGSPGTGKSKFAIELAKLYSDKNDFSFLCIGNKGISIWEDLKTIIRTDKKYLLLVDDANRLAKNFQWILSLFEERASKSLKVIVTVRDYALPQIKSIAASYSYASIEIKAFSNDEIKTIIQSDNFKIKEPSYVDRILKIAQGNARLAIMCAKVALNAKNILELNDASQIYDEYYEPLFNEIELLKEPVAQKSLALISFFSRIDKENREFCDFIFKSLEVEENKFWEICYALHESELVDLFEQQVVKISDQIFSTYIFYKAVIYNELLNFSFFLNNYLDYENRITDTIVPVINTFSYKQIETKLKPIILKKWLEIEKEGNHQDSLKYLDLFWFYLSPQVLNFIKKQIDNQEAETTEFRYNYELNEFSYGTGKDLEILSRFRYNSDELFKDALELMFYYAIKVPSKMPAVIYIIKEKFSFTRLGYMYGDRIQHLLFDFLIHNAQNSSNKIIYENVLTEIIPDFLKLEFNEHEGNGRGITFWSFHLWLSESIKDFRLKCYNYLLQNASKPSLLQIMYKLNYYEFKDSEEILQHDLKYIYQILNTRFKPDEFEDCFVLQNILEGLGCLKIDYSKEIKNEYRSKLYQLAEVLKQNSQRERKLGWDEEEKLHKEELQEYCLDFEINNYESLLTNISLILEHVKKVSKGNSVWQYENSLNTIFGNLAQADVKLFLNVLELNFTKFNFNLNFTYIFNYFFRTNSGYYFELFQLIEDLEVNPKFSFHNALKIDEVKQEHLSILYSDLLSSIQSLNIKYIFWDLTFVSKYKKLKDENDIYAEILKITLAKIKNENVKISVGEHFIEKCLSLNNFPFDIIVEAYLYSNNIENHFDYENKILKKLLERDPNILIRVLQFNSHNQMYYKDLEYDSYDFVWEMDNCNTVMNSIFEYFITSQPCFSPERAISTFFPGTTDKYDKKPIKYLENLIDEKYLNAEYIDIAFSIICIKYPVLKMNFLERFLKLNSNIEIFKTLEIIPRMQSWSGSHIPILEGEKKIWENVISIIDRLPNRVNYYGHKDYANRQIGYCDLEIKSDMKREFYEDFR